MNAKKPNFAFHDFNDVMLGSPAVFASDQARGWLSANKQIPKTRGFPPPPRDGFGFGCLKLS